MPSSLRDTLKTLAFGLLAFFPFCQSNAVSTNLFTNSTTLSQDGWKETWMGIVNDQGNDWVYHGSLGWIMPADATNSSVWFYHQDLNWVWTQDGVYNWGYFHKLSEWRYYLAGVGFYDNSTQEWSDLATLVSKFPDDQIIISDEDIAKIEMSSSGISYYKADAAAIGGYVLVEEETTGNVTGNLKYLQGDTAFEIRARCYVENYRNQAISGGPVNLTIDGQTTANTITIERDDENDQMVVTGNGIPNYIPTLVGIDVSNGWNEGVSGGFESLKLSEENEGASGNNNPNQLVIAEEVFRIPLSPVNNSTSTDTELGTVGAALNGMPIFNPFEDPNETAAYGRVFASCCGHPQQDGQYHYHKYPTCLRLISDEWKSEKEKCDEIDALLVEGGHSPLLGFAVDGWPVYGPVGWPDSSSTVGVIMESSYTGADDSNGNASYVAGSGHLDDCNGLVSPTPEFPEGIYHYHMTIKKDDDGTVLRYLNPYFGYDVRNTLNKHDLMPTSWSNDSTYVSELKAGFTVNGVSINGTNSYSTFVAFIEGMQNTLSANGMSNVATEFETMQIAYPFTIRKYRGDPSASGVGNGMGGDTGGVETNGVVSISPTNGSRGNTVTVTITVDGNNQPPPPPANAPGTPTVTVGGISLTGVSRPSDTTVSGSLTIPSNTSTGTKDIIVNFTTPMGDLELTGAAMFTVQ